LRELSKVSAAFSLIEDDRIEWVKGGEEESLERYKYVLNAKISQQRLTPMMRDELMQAVPCQECQKPCYDNYIKGMEISPTVTKSSKSFAYCSTICLKTDHRYRSNNLYYYSKFE
jgi:hypothetical protein